MRFYQRYLVTATFALPLKGIIHSNRKTVPYYLKTAYSLSEWDKTGECSRGKIRKKRGAHKESVVRTLVSGIMGACLAHNSRDFDQKALQSTRSASDCHILCKHPLTRVRRKDTVPSDWPSNWTQQSSNALKALARTALTHAENAPGQWVNPTPLTAKVRYVRDTMQFEVYRVSPRIV